MKSDSLFYQLFQELPSSYFEAIGADATTAEEYTFQSEEIKQAGLRLDGVFVPSRAAAPVHFVEVYFYATPNVFSNLVAKVFLWLETKNPGQDWHASVFFANRRLEPANLRPYRNLIESDQVSRVYLDELPEPGESQVGLGTLNLITAPRERTAAKATALLSRLTKVEKPGAKRGKLVELIENAVLAHFPQLTREELENMVQTLDLRQTKVFQEAKAEGKAEGKEETREEIALRLLKEKFSPAEVVKLTGLTLRHVQRLRKKTGT